MGILLELNENKKNGELVEANSYADFLKLEILEHHCQNISEYIAGNKLQKAIEYTEENTKKIYGFPLRTGEKIFSNVNELIINEKAKFRNFFIYLKKELLSCKEFFFVVSFIKFSGIQLLLSTLDELESRGIKGKIITSVYLNITDSKALKKLLEYRNIEVKVYNNSKESFHTKAYLFKKEKYHTCIIGSSNISQSALYSAEEWNVKLTNNNFFDIYEKSFSQFEKLWNSSEAAELTEDFVDEYEKYKKTAGLQETFDYFKTKEKQNQFHPNSMQKEILEKLENTRKKGNRKGLVVSATGTGKTYLAMMDIRNFFQSGESVSYAAGERGLGKRKESFLFLAHREELLENGIKVCKKIMNLDETEIGRVYGSKKETGKKVIFATVQSLKNKYRNFSQDYFDYIVVDEFHHSSAKTYTKIINYFNPEFMLGLTATPERMDGKDILELCGYNLVGEIGLRRALEEDLIAPFHYFGVNDEIINYENIPYSNGKYDEKILTESLSDNRRTEFIIEKIRKIGFDGEKMSCIAFCENIAHAEFMKKNFLKNGYRAEILTSKTLRKNRRRIIEKFEEKRIEILCVVDILNEGVDIPDINLLLFLRPTFSSTVFIQQIGRGLRKIKGKNFVTIIDFIGNHRKDYIITKVFSEEILERNLLYSKKEKLIDEIKNQFSNIPAASYIELDRICQDRIIRKIEKINYSSKNTLRDMYYEYKIEIGKESEEILEVSDFDRNIELFMELVMKFGSFYEAQLQLEKKYFENNQESENKLKIFESKGKNYKKVLKKNLRKQNIELLAYLEKKLKLVEPFVYLIFKRLLKSKINGCYFKEKILDAENLLQDYKICFKTETEFKNGYLIRRIFKELEEDEILEQTLYGYKISGKYENAFLDSESEFDKRLEQLLILGLNEFRKNDLEEFNENVLITHKEYMRLDLQILLDSKVPKGTWRAGYANTEKDICLFITYDKSHITQENLKYDNSLHTDSIIQWISQPKTYHESSVGQMFIRHKEKNIKVHIFARKYAFMNNSKTNPFIYLGKADYYKSYGDKPMTLLWKLEKEIPYSLIKEFYE